MKVKDYIAFALCKEMNNETIIIVDGYVKYKVIVKNQDYDYSDYIPGEVLEKTIGQPIISKRRTTIFTH